MRHILLATAALCVALPAAAQDRAALATIIDQGTNHSQVVQTAQYLTDVIGPRLANSPGARAAEAWTQGKFREWGLRNVRKEGFAFGRGWAIERASVRMVTPRPVQLTAIPVAWTPGTNGTITAPVIVAPGIDPRYAGDFQPLYPAGEQRMGRSGEVTVRVLIGTDGRVKQVEPVSATSDAFLRATTDQAKRRWRFAPGTRDGVAQEAWRVMTVTFVLQE